MERLVFKFVCTVNVGETVALKNRAFHFPLPDLRNGASLPSPHVRNSGFRPFRMWHPRVRTRRTGGFRSHGSHASKRRSSRRNRPINQSINHLECAHNQLLHVYTHTHGGGNRRIVRPLRTDSNGNEVAKPSDDDHHGRTARLRNGAFLAAQLQETLRNGAYPPDPCFLNPRHSSPRLGFIPRGKLHWIFPGG